MNIFFRKRGKINFKGDIDPDEIFLDSENLPGFDNDQFEGRIEKPITQKTILFLGIFFVLVTLFFVWRLFDLQIIDGKEYAKQSEENSLRNSIIFADRGNIYDILGIPIAWNEPQDSENEFSSRKYMNDVGLSSLVGYVSYPKKDSAGFYFDTEVKGVDGLELVYNDLLAGENGLKIIEVNAINEIIDKTTTRPPEHGKDINLTIDLEVQKAFYDSIKKIIMENGFEGGGGVIMDVLNGDILALVNFPDYDQNILSNGKDNQKILEYINNPLNPFLDRISTGLYTPGSIVKPYIAIAALSENIISPTREILSTKEMEVPNPFNPDNPSYFSDWKAHGYVDMSSALAYSSNIYFYQIGGGYGDLKGLGITKINEYLKKFGFGEEINSPEFSGAYGTVPNPEWKEKTFNDIWRLGDTYFTAIGQYGFQVTPLQVVRAVAAIANEGNLIEPRIVADTMAAPKVHRQIDIEPEFFQEVKKGMREAVEYGTAKGLSYPDFSIAAKTGTAELGVTKEKVNSWTTGFFPYENPRYAFTVVLEKGERSNLIGGVAVTRSFLDWLKINKPEYIK